MRVPAEIYDLSPRPMPSTLPDHDYAAGLEARRVRSDGSMKWRGSCVFVGEAMRGEVIGVEPVDNGVWHVHLGPMRLGALHERSKMVVPLALDADPESVTHVPGHPEIGDPHDPSPAAD